MLQCASSVLQWSLATDIMSAYQNSMPWTVDQEQLFALSSVLWYCHWAQAMMQCQLTRVRLYLVKSWLTEQDIIIMPITPSHAADTTSGLLREKRWGSCPVPGCKGAKGERGDFGPVGPQVLQLFWLQLMWKVCSYFWLFWQGYQGVRGPPGYCDAAVS